MGGNKTLFGENNNDPEFSKLDEQGNKVPMGNARRPNQRLGPLSSDDSFSFSFMGISEDKEAETKEPINWNFFGLAKSEQAEEQGEDFTPFWGQTSTMCPESALSEDDDEYLFRAMSSISSTRSSISWAEDAVEAEFTDQLAALWEDVEKVCAGGDKPVEMTNAVYDECLQWRRAFPQQTLLLPSRFADIRAPQSEDEDSTPTPTNDSQKGLLDDIVVDSSFSVLPEDSRSLKEDSPEECLTPNPNTSSQYVTSWLADCRHSEFPFPESEGEKPVIFPKIGNDFSISKPVARNKPSSMIKEESDLSEEEEGGESYNSLTWGQSNPSVKVQRPISSYAKGHLMTPMRKLPESSSQSYTSYSKYANFIKSTPNPENPNPNRILSSIPAGRVLPNNEMRSPPTTYPLKEERVNSSYDNRRSSYGQLDSFQKSRTTLPSINSNRQSAHGPIPSSASPSWSRHTKSNSPLSQQEETAGQGETFFDFSQGDCCQSQIRRRPSNLPIENKTPSESVPVERPIKPFLYWLFDRVSPN